MFISITGQGRVPFHSDLITVMGNLFLLFGSLPINIVKTQVLSNEQNDEVSASRRNDADRSNEAGLH